jgi:hypothetical protein
MLKRLTVALAALFVLSAQCFAAGTIPYSLSQQFDQYGHVLAGCKLYIIQAGTVGTPQTAYQDSALTIPVSGGSQITCDAAGRLPQFFLADGSIKILLTDANGVTQVSADGILVVGASSGGGGGSPVDATTILTTGDIKVVYGTGVVTGFVRANGRTIGSATSGATERANADTQALFLYLWGADANLTVSTGRGVSAAADWAANKTITLPDMRGRVIAGADDMGNSAANVLSTSVCVNNTTVLGSVCGSQQRTIAQNVLPNVTLSYSNSVTVTSNESNLFHGSGVNGIQSPGAGGIFAVSGIGAFNGSTTASGTSSGNTASINGGVSQSAFTTIQPSIIMTYYVKL